jgi:hypothetical protein
MKPKSNIQGITIRGFERKGACRNGKRERGITAGAQGSNAKIGFVLDALDLFLRCPNPVRSIAERNTKPTGSKLIMVV